MREMETVHGRQIADIHNRFGAFLIDWHIRTIPVALWGFWIFFKWFPDYWTASLRGTPGLDTAWQLLEPVLQQDAIMLTGVLSLIPYLLYHPVVELIMNGNTPGKRMMRISVVTLEGNPPSPRQILVRNLWRAIEFLPIGYLWGMLAILHSPQNARTGDIRAGTRVVVDGRH